MATTDPSRYRLVWMLLSVGGVVIWCWMLFRAGCAGDAQTGSRPDQLRAMEVERFAAPFLLGAAAAGLAYIASLKHLPRSKRVIWATRLILFGLPIGWVLGVQFQLLALRICF